MSSVENNISGGSFESLVQAHTVTQNFYAPVKPPLVPRMLPYPPDVFVDREAARAALDGLAAGLGERKSPHVAVISGLSGVGKSGLAVYWSAGREADFPGGVFYADLSPRGPLHPADPAAVLQAFIGALGTPRDEMPAEVGDLAGRFRMLTRAAPYLVLLDGVVSAAQVEPLLPGHPASLVLVTSCQRLSGLGVAGPSRPAAFPLGGLDDDACTELFQAMAGDGHADAAVLRTLVPTFGGLPLVARIAGAWAGDPFNGGTAALVRRLSARHSLLEAFAMSEEFDVSPHFAAAVQGLGEVEAGVLRVLAVHPTAEFADALVDGLAAFGVRRSLLEKHLLEPSGPGRCRMNRLLQEYVRTLVSGEQRAVAEDGIVDWYLRRAAVVELLVSQRWHDSAVFADPDLPFGDFAGESEALDAMEGDRENAAAVVELAYDTGRFASVCQLVEALRGFYFRRKHHTLWLEVCGRGVDAAGHLGDGLLLARMHYETAFARFDRGSAEDLEIAKQHYAAALEGARQVPHARTESSALEGLGQVAFRQGRPLEALDLLGQALDALGDTVHPRGRALLEFHRGTAASAACEHAEAAALLLSARRQFAELAEPDRYNEAKSLTRYAEARLAADRADEALPATEEALKLYSDLDAPKEKADAHLVRGDALQATGSLDQARLEWESAFSVYLSLGSIRTEDARRRLIETA